MFKNAVVKLGKIVGKKNILNDPRILNEYSGGIVSIPRKMPSCVIRPSDIDELQAVVRWANENKTPLEKPKWHENRSWWIEISIAFILSGILLFFNLSVIMIFQFEGTSIIYIIYSIIEFFIQAVIILAIIVIIEYFILFKFIK